MGNLFTRNSFNHSSEGRGHIVKQDFYPLINSMGVSGSPKAVPGGSCLVTKPSAGPSIETERNPAAANLDSAASTESPITLGMERGSGPVEINISTSAPSNRTLRRRFKSHYVTFGNKFVPYAYTSCNQS